MINFFWPKDNLVLESPWLRCLVFCNKGIFISELSKYMYMFKGQNIFYNLEIPH